MKDLPFICYLPSPNVELRFQIPVGKMPVEEQQTMDQNTREVHRQRQHRTEQKDNTPSPRIKIKIPNSAWNRTRAAGLEGRASTNHTTGTDYNVLYVKIFINVVLVFSKLKCLIETTGNIPNILKW